MRERCHLVVFSKYPKLGLGKKRLAKDIGAVAALRFQRVNLMLILLRLGRDCRWNTWLAITPDKSGPWPSGLRTLPQGQGDLGQRMRAVLRALPSGPAVVIGSDIPGIATASIRDAFRALGHNDAVFGPATDGGYWLVGLRRCPRVVTPFQHVRWSTEHALADTLRNLAHEKIAFLPALTDVDDAQSLSQCPDWHRFFHNPILRRSECCRANRDNSSDSSP